MDSKTRYGYRRKSLSAASLSLLNTTPPVVSLTNRSVAPSLMAEFRQNFNHGSSIIPTTDGPTLSSDTHVNSNRAKVKNNNFPSILRVLSKTKPSHSYPDLQLVKPDCSTVHIAMVVTSDIESIHLHTTIKSILIHRSTPLHFHFITDRTGKTVLHTIMSTWLLPPFHITIMTSLKRGRTSAPD